VYPAAGGRGWEVLSYDASSMAILELDTSAQDMLARALLEVPSRCYLKHALIQVGNFAIRSRASPCRARAQPKSVAFLLTNVPVWCAGAIHTAAAAALSAAKLPHGECAEPAAGVQGEGMEGTAWPSSQVG
jgi:hypothetical protein